MISSKHGMVCKCKQRYLLLPLVRIEHDWLNSMIVVVICHDLCLFQAGGQIKLMVLREEDVEDGDSHSMASGSEVNASWVS